MNPSSPTRPRFRPQSGESVKHWLFVWLLSFVLKTIWTAVIALACVFAVEMFRHRTAESESSRSRTDGPPATAAVPAPSQNTQTVELTTAASIQKQQLTAAKFKQRQLLATYEETKRALEEWEREAAAWENLGPPLLSNDGGKRVAADSTLARRFRAIITQERPSKEELARVKAQAEELITPVREAFENPADASIPLESTAPALREMLVQARKTRDTYREARTGVEGLIAQATAPPASRTLEEAITALNREDAIARADYIEAEEKKVKDEGTRLVAEERMKLAQVVAQNEMAKVRDEAERQRQGLFHSGSVWKGTRTVRGQNCPSTLTIVKREKDRIEGTVAWTYERRPATMTIEGTVQGNTVSITVTAVMSGAGMSGETATLQFDPKTQAMSGSYESQGVPGGPASYRYAKEGE